MLRLQVYELPNELNLVTYFTRNYFMEKWIKNASYSRLFTVKSSQPIMRCLRLVFVPVSYTREYINEG